MFRNSIELPSPVADQRPETTSRFGETLTDPYAWLRDSNWQEVMRDPNKLDADIRDYLEAENKYLDGQLGDTCDLQKELVAEMRGRIKEDDSSVPLPDGAFEYYSRYDEGAEHPILCRRARGGADDAETIIVDGPSEAEGKPYYRLGMCDHSPDQRLAAYAVDETGSEYMEIRIIDLETGKLIADRLTNAQGDTAWSADSKTLFYTVLDGHHRPKWIYHHVIGNDPAQDTLVYEEADDTFHLGLGKTQSERFIVIEAAGHSTTSESWIIPADKPTELPRVFHPREMGHEYDVEDIGGHWYIRTNTDGAKDFKIMSAPLDGFDRNQWNDIVPHRPGVLLRRMLAYSDFLVWLVREEGLSQIHIRRLSDETYYPIAFDEEAYELGVVSGYEFETEWLRFTYSSMTTPNRTYDFDMNLRERILRKEQEIPTGHNPADYVTRRLWAKSEDGTRVPVSVLHRADAAIDGSAPLLLYGYGAYGFSMPASFAANRLSLVDRGFIYAIAHIRGGTEMGFEWYERGKLEHKTNSFKDFIAAAEHLIAEGYTAAGKIAAQGRSAGGMLMGAIANMRPDLFGAVSAEVPFVDVLNTMCDESLPLTPPEWTEWGNPIEDEDAFRRMRAYSPYDNISAQAYPHILAIGGLTDPRVTYWEPAKWVAKLRATRTDDRVTLLYTVMEAGHGGAAGRFERLEEIAIVFAFFLKAFDRAT